MAKIKDILNLVREFSPENATEPDFEDNVGLLVGSENGDTDNVLVCLDASGDVICEAADTGARLVLSHHPIIFRQINSITDKTPTGRAILSAITSGISVYSAHTNLDFCRGGINDYNALLLGLTEVTPLVTVSGIDIGRVGNLIRPTDVKDLASYARKTFDDGYCGYVGSGPVRRVAVINGGAGDIEYIDAAMRAKADCYISADFRHHVLLYAQEVGIKVIHMQHYAMEHIFINKWTEILSAAAEKAHISVKFMAAKSECNPTTEVL